MAELRIEPALQDQLADVPAEDEERFQALAEGAPVMIWRSGLDKRFDYVNRHWLDFTGQNFDRELGLGWTKGLYPDDYRRTLDVLAAAHAARLPFTTDFQLRRRDGEFRWLLCNGVPFCRKGSFAGLLGSCVDISAHQFETGNADREADTRQAVLRQLNHRVKNSLQTSISFSAFGREFGDPRTLDELSDMTERLSLLAFAHDQLDRLQPQSNAGFCDYLRGVAEAVHAAIGKTNVALRFTCEPVGVSPKRATALGTILDELLTMALRDRFPPDRPGTIRVETRPLPGRGFELLVADDGISDAVAEPAQASFRRQLVERLTAHANGTIRYEKNGGTRCIITLNPD